MSKESVGRIVLHPLLSRQLRPGVVIIVRADGASAIRVDALGAETVRMLSRGSSPEEVELELSSRYGETLSVGELLNALERARMIRTWGTRSVNHERLSFRARAACLWRVGVAWEDRLPRLACRVLPPALALKTIRAVRRRKLGAVIARVPDSEFVQRIPAETDPGDVERKRRRHLEYLAAGDALARLVCEARPKSVARWLERRVTIVGEEKLLSAESRKRGVIVALLHQGTFPIIVPTLMMLGKEVHSFNFGVDFATRSFNDIMEQLSQAFRSPASRSYGSGAASEIRSFLRGLARGGFGILTLDYYGGIRPLTGNSDQTSEEARPNSVEVPFGRRSMQVQTFAGWIARRSAAPVLPCVCTGSATTGMVVSFGDPVTVGPHLSSSAATSQIFAQLAPDLVRRPEDWTFLLRYVHGSKSLESS